MQIHVVTAGDTVTLISRQYNIPVSTLISSNEIPNPNELVPGQALVIPIWGSYYFVKHGDSLYSIALRYKMPVEQLKELNNLQNSSVLRVGMRIYIPQPTRTPIYSGAYNDTDISGDRTTEIIEDVGEYLSTIQIFSYHVDSTGKLTPPQREDEALAAIKRVNVTPIMVLANIEEGRFSTEAATAILSDEALQDTLLTNILAIMNQKGYKGLDVDFEYLGAENRERYNKFLVKAKDKLKPDGYSLSTALAPKLRDNQVGTLYEGHDYAFHGKIADYIFFMTYEWGWTGGAPRAVAPLDEVKKVMDYAISRVPKEKIMMGIPLYGYDWKLPFVAGESRARAISSQEAILLANRYKVSINYDPVSAAPFFKYVDESDVEHEVWFEDARSIQAKFELVKSLGIRGFFYWVLGRDFPQNWLLIEDNFVVRKA